MKDEELQSDLPDDVVAELRRYDRRVSFMTGRVDARIASEASAYFAGREASAPAESDAREGSPSRRSWLAPAAIAAGLVAAAIGLRLLVDTSPAPVIADDIDGSGAVDILDAYALARSGAEGQGDVSQSEIDALIARIVALEPREELL